MIVETRDWAEHRGPARSAELAVGMQREGVPATIFLAENAVFAARRGSESTLDGAIAKGVTVAADSFALKERAIDPSELRKGIAVADVDLIVDKLAGGSSVMWR
jgi:hypothetical protein